MINVLGAGIVGSTVARRLRAAGHSVYLIASRDHPAAASYAAVAVMRESWVPPEFRAALRAAYPPSFEAAIYQRWDGVWRQQSGWRAVAPGRYLEMPDCYYEDGYKFTTNAVDCTGAVGTGPLRTAISPNWGCTAIVRGRIDDPLIVYHITPYQGVAIFRITDDLLRVGSTASVDESHAVQLMRERLYEIVDRGIISGYRYADFMTGQRALNPQKDYTVKMGPGYIITPKVGRLGFALAPGIAEQVVELCSR